MATHAEMILKNARAVAIIHRDVPAEADAIEELALWALDLQRANDEKAGYLKDLNEALNLSQAREAGTLGRLETTTSHLKVANATLREREQALQQHARELLDLRGQLEADQSDLQKLRRSLAETREALRLEILESAETEAKCVILQQNNALLADQREQEVKRRKEIAAEWERARQMQSMMMVPPIDAKLSPSDVDFGDPSHGQPGEIGHVIHERFGTRRGVVMASPGEGTGLRVHSDAVPLIQDLEAEGFDVRSRLRSASEGR